MCQWKFFVFTYSANTSARMAFIVPLISLTAAADRSVRVARGASRLCANSSLFLELGLFIVIRPSFFERLDSLHCSSASNLRLFLTALLPGFHYQGSQS